MEIPRVEPSLENASTLPSRCYVAPEWLERERKAIFHRSWQYAGHVEWAASPGQRFPVDLYGEPLTLARGLDGELRALSNVCRHRAGPLVDKPACVKTLQCRYHGWTYDLDGKLRAAPEFDGVAQWSADSVRLPSFSVAPWGPLAFVALSERAPAFSDFFGEISASVASAGIDLGAFRFAYRRDYIVNCNWKTYVDNYLEGYHIPLVHPALYRELDYSEYRVETFRYHSHQHAPVRRATGGGRRYEASDRPALYYWVFPNLMINIYPDNLSTNVVVPLDSERTLTIFEWFVLGDSPLARSGGAPFSPVTAAIGDAPPESDTLADLVDFSHQVQLEDIAICEAVQRGLHSGTYDRGRYCLKRENGVHHFHLLWEEFLKDAE